MSQKEAKVPRATSHAAHPHSAFPQPPLVLTSPRRGRDATRRTFVRTLRAYCFASQRRAIQPAGFHARSSGIHHVTIAFAPNLRRGHGQHADGTTLWQSPDFPPDSSDVDRFCIDWRRCRAPHARPCSCIRSRCDLVVVPTADSPEIAAFWGARRRAGPAQLRSSVGDRSVFVIRAKNDRRRPCGRRRSRFESSTHSGLPEELS